MPLSESEQTNKTAAGLVDVLRAIYNTPPDQRPGHSRGQLARGTFTPTKEAAALSVAQIFHQSVTPLIVRFSSSTGDPEIPDFDPSSNPRGLAIRFVLSEDGQAHYDITTHAKNGFAVRTGEGFLEMLSAVKDGTVDQFLANSSTARKFNDTPCGNPKSFATEKFFGVNAFEFINDRGETIFFRYRLVPDSEAVAYFSQEEAHAKGKDYLYEELTSRLTSPYGVIKFRLLAQIAEKGDPTNDATQPWPESRRLVHLGTVEVNQSWDLTKGDGVEQKGIIFDPIPRHIQGIKASDDPLLDLRAAAYLISGRKRREASGIA